MERVFAHKLSGRRHTAVDGTLQCDVYVASQWLIEVTGKTEEEAAEAIAVAPEPQNEIRTPEEEAEEVAFLEG